MVKGITLGVVTSMLTIGGGGGGGGGDNVDVDLCLSVSCINYVSDQAEYLENEGWITRLTRLASEVLIETVQNIGSKKTQ